MEDGRLLLETKPPDKFPQGRDNYYSLCGFH